MVLFHSSACHCPVFPTPFVEETFFPLDNLSFFVKDDLNIKREVSGRWARWVMGVKEGTCDEHWVLNVSDESLNSTPETNIALYANLKFKYKKRERDRQTDTAVVLDSLYLLLQIHPSLAYDLGS